ncbi:MAG: ParA family protein [Cytophagales bacterium]|nr:ParA family protein [Cytophagales bacterium]
MGGIAAPNILIKHIQNRTCLKKPIKYLLKIKFIMCKVLAVSNLKGGVGKTTTSNCLANGLALRGYKVLAIDLDSQGNLSSSMKIMDPEFTINGSLNKTYKIKAYSVRPNLALVACDKSFSSFDKVHSETLDKEFMLKELIEPLKKSCDFIVLDCSPSLGLATVNAYAASDYVITPVEAASFSISGLDGVKETILKIQRRINPQLKLISILFTRYDRRKILKREIMDEISEKYPEEVFRTVIRESISLSEMSHVGKSIFEWAPDSAGATDYTEFINELLEKLK